MKDYNCLKITHFLVWGWGGRSKYFLWISIEICREIRMISSIKRSNDFDDFDLALTKYEKGWE